MIKLLLDTHTLLWLFRERHLLSAKVIEAITDAGADAAVSLASLWEIAIKSSINKRCPPKSYEELFPHPVTDSGLSLLAIEPAHLALVSRLPLNHRDPFDWLIIAQALEEDDTLVSYGGGFSAYGVKTLG